MLHPNFNATAGTSLDKANLLNISFANTFNHSVPVLTTADIPNISSAHCVGELLCTEEEVYDLLCGMLKETALSVTSAVTKLFNTSNQIRHYSFRMEDRTCHTHP